MYKQLRTLHAAGMINGELLLPTSNVPSQKKQRSDMDHEAFQAEHVVVVVQN